MRFSLRTHPPPAFANAVSASYQGHASLYTTEGAKDGSVDFEFIILLLMENWRNDDKQGNDELKISQTVLGLR
jgi:hypothetical protein